MPMFVQLIEALSLLAPSEVASMTKVRIGNAFSDGGYVLADRFRPGQKVYSYGISNEVSFDLDMANRGLHIFMYDHTITDTPRKHPNFHFYREGISARNEPDRSVFRLDHHIETNGHIDDDMILKIDVEGAEWEVLDDLDTQLSARFEQIVMEIHSLDKLTESDFRARFVRGISRLNSQFNVVHVHANNCGFISNFNGLPIPTILEVTLLRKDLGQASPWQSFIPTNLDAANSPLRPDHVLAFYPFLPTGLAAAEFKTGLTGALLRANQPLHARITAMIPTRGVNIARHGVCSQSSFSPWSVGRDEANRALRAEKNGRFAFHTDFENNPWWQIDLGGEISFDEIICFNRIDVCADRAENLVVESSADGVNWNVLHQNEGAFGGIDGNPLRVVTPRTAARYVRLRIQAETALHLDAVEIYDWTAEDARPSVIPPAAP